MDEDQFWRSVPFLLLRLFHAAAREVPNHYAAVGACAGENVARLSTEFHLVHFFLVLSKREQLGLRVPGVPHSYATVRTTSQQQVGFEGTVVNAHNFCNVCLDALATLLLTRIPNFELLVITHTSKLAHIVVVPGHVLND